MWVSSHVAFWKGAAIWVSPYEAVAPSALLVFVCPCEGTGWLFERNSRSGYVCWHTSQRDVSLFSPDCYFWTFLGVGEVFPDDLHRLMSKTSPERLLGVALCVCGEEQRGLSSLPGRLYWLPSPLCHLLPVSCVHSMLNINLGESWECFTSETVDNAACMRVLSQKVVWLSHGRLPVLPVTEITWLSLVFILFFCFWGVYVCQCE